MCNNNNNGNENASSSPLASSSSSLVPYSLKTLQAAVAAAVNHSDPHAAYMALHPSAGPTATQLTQAALDHYRMQLYNYVSYADRLRYHHHPAQVVTHQGYASLPLHPSSAAAAAAAAAAAEVYMPYAKFDPCRAYRMHQEEPKPQHSYIGLIGMAILSAPDKKLVLSDIYQHILDNYSYFRNRGPGWRNSIRHNLSLNDCFVKAGRSANGKGHFWAIHPANLEDFKKGDFRRRKAQRRVRKHLGLSIPEDDDSLSPPPPTSATLVHPPPPTAHTIAAPPQQQQAPSSSSSWGVEKPDSTTSGGVMMLKKRFDMDSILAPERSSRCACCDLSSAPCHLGLKSAPPPSGGGGGWSHQMNKAETKQEMEVEEDEEEVKTERLMLDECSSSSLVTETHTNWALPVDECDSRPHSRSSSSASSGSCSVASSGYGPMTTSGSGKGEKGLFLLKGLQGYHEAFLTTKRPLTLAAAADEGPLLLNGKPNSISDSDKRVSGNQA